MRSVLLVLLLACVVLTAGCIRADNASAKMVSGNVVAIASGDGGVDITFDDGRFLHIHRASFPEGFEIVLGECYTIDYIKDAEVHFGTYDRINGIERCAI